MASSQVNTGEAPAPPAAPAGKGGRRKRGHSQGEGKSIHAQGSTLADTLKRFKAYDESKMETCEKCGEISGLKAMIKCESCEHYLHLKCCGIGQIYQESARDLLHLAGWSCRDCRIGKVEKHLAMERALTDLTQQLNSLKAEFNKLVSTVHQNNEENQTTTNNSNDRELGGTGGERVAGAGGKEGGGERGGGPATGLTRAQVVTLVTKTVGDKERRRKNVIITGLPETTPENDSQAFSNLCEQYLFTRPPISRLGTKRLGQASVNANKHRRLLVHLDSEAAASDILRSARQLRESDDPYVASNIFINADLSIADQKAAFERRTQRRQRGTGSTAAPPVDRPDPHTTQTTMDTSTQQDNMRVFRSEHQSISAMPYQANPLPCSQPEPRPWQNTWPTIPSPFQSNIPQLQQSGPNQLHQHAATTTAPMYHISSSQHNIHPLTPSATATNPYQAHLPIYSCPPGMISGLHSVPTPSVVYHNHQDMLQTSQQPFRIPYAPSPCHHTLPQPT